MDFRLLRLGRFGAISLIVAMAVSVLAQEPPEPPVALVLSGNEAQLLRRGAELALSAKPGELLFAGDSVRNGSGLLTLLACTANKQYTFAANAELAIDSSQIRVKSGKTLAENPAAGCFLPPLPRSIIASQQHGGASIAQERAVSLGIMERRLAALPEAERKTITEGLQSFGPQETTDPVAQLGRAALLEKSGLYLDAADAMRRVVSAWPDAAWARSRLFVLEVQAAGKSASPPTPEEPGQTYALLVGISSFKDPGIPKLGFAHQDAEDLARMIESPRAGSVPPENVVLLTNEKATTNGIRDAIETQLKARAKKNDTVLVFIASHGVTIPTDRKEKGFVVTYDTSPQDPATTAISMDEIHKLFEDQLNNVKRLYLYIDVCHAGQVGQIYPKAELISKTTENALRGVEDVQLFGMLAAQKGQVAMEGVVYGGGHGAFTYFLLRALNGDADFNHDGRVTMDELAQYVEDRVRDATANQQIPKSVGDIDENLALAFTDKPGIQLKEFFGKTMLASRGFTPRQVEPEQPAPAAGSRYLKYQDSVKLLEAYENAVRGGRIDPTAEGSAFTYLAALKAKLNVEDYRLEAGQLQVSLEDKGQEVLLTYLAGEEAPQKRSDFLAGQAYFEAAKLLATDSVYLESRATFCRGRVAIFDKDYARAAAALERAIRLDPERAYSYNALGIAYLEQAQYERAILAFREAAKRAPYWAYPMHNLALAYSERGDDGRAEDTYRRAMRLAPRVAYLPYNLGLLYQRMNRREEADQNYKAALALAPNSAIVRNAIGYLRASSGKAAEAEKWYRSALDKDAGFLPARHNLALLLSSRNREPEAIRLWRQNLTQDSTYLPSRLSLARVLARGGEMDQAGQEYLKVIQSKPDYLSARVALADLYLKQNRPEQALDQLEQARRIEPNSVEILVPIGDAYAAMQKNAEASAAYTRALDLAVGSAEKKRIRARLKKLGALP